MSIAQGTTHYDYPQVQLNDRPTFADFNPAFADIDAKLYGLITGATTDEQAIADLATAVGNLRTDLGGVSDVATAAKNKADSNEEAIGLLSTQVSQNTTKLGTKIDSNAIAEPYDTSATYAVGDVVTYQGQRYRCTTAVAVAEPFDATKWTGEDVETVLTQINTALSGKANASDLIWTSVFDTQYIKIYKKKGLVLIEFIGQSSAGTSEGNLFNLATSSINAPLPICDTFGEMNGCAVKVGADGKVSLMASDYGSYIADTVIGTVFYATNN